MHFQSTASSKTLVFKQLPGYNPLGIVVELHTLNKPLAAHSHDFWEITFAMRGSGHHEDEQMRAPLLSGDVWIIPPGQWHAFPFVKHPLTIFNLLFSCEFMDTHVALLQHLQLFPTEEATLQYVHISTQKLDHIGALLAELAAEQRASHHAGHAGICIGLFLQIVGELERSIAAHAIQKESHFTASRRDEGLLSAISLIEGNYTDPLTLEDIAQQSGYTPTSLIRKFRQHIGMTPIDYLFQVRLQHACELLRRTNDSVNSIASKTGFSDSRYFATRFRTMLGMTPSEYREQCRGNQSM